MPHKYLKNMDFSEKIKKGESIVTLSFIGPEAKKRRLDNIPTTRLIGDSYGGQEYKYDTSLLAKNGKIYAAPADAYQVLEIEP